MTKLEGEPSNNEVDLPAYDTTKYEIQVPWMVNEAAALTCNREKLMGQLEIAIQLDSTLRHSIAMEAALEMRKIGKIVTDLDTHAPRLDNDTWRSFIELLAHQPVDETQ